MVLDYLTAFTPLDAREATDIRKLFLNATYLKMLFLYVYKSIHELFLNHIKFFGYSFENNKFYLNERILF